MMKQLLRQPEPLAHVGPSTSGKVVFQNQGHFALLWHGMGFSRGS